VASAAEVRSLFREAIAFVLLLFLLMEFIFLRFLPKKRMSSPAITQITQNKQDMCNIFPCSIRYNRTIGSKQETPGAMASGFLVKAALVAWNQDFT
jgi:hypothetical protein